MPYPNTTNTVTPYIDFDASVEGRIKARLEKEAQLREDLPVVGAVSAHYTIRSQEGTQEVGNIDTLHDAILFAKTWSELTMTPFHVIEHKFTETTIGVYGMEYL